MSLILRTAPGQAERAAFIGVTRSGKTTLMRELAGGCSSIVVFDSKQNPGDWSQWAGAHGWAVSRDPAAVGMYPRVVLLVDSRWIQDRSGWSKPGSMGWNWTAALGTLIDRQAPGASTVAIFDEGMHTMALNPHPDARRVMTQGAALGFAVWLGTQAPNWVDTVALAQCEHAIAFATYNATHRKILEERRGIDCRVLAELAGPDHQDVDRRHEFAHHRIGAAAWERFAPIEFRTSVAGSEAKTGAAPAEVVGLTDTPAG